MAQQDRMVWPAAVADEMAKLGYLDELEKGSRVGFIYKDSYADELDRVREIVTPFDPEYQTGLVDIPEIVLPRANTEAWVGFGPNGAQMWEAQEDLWLLAAIMEAVARVNKDATSIIDAPIKSIQEVTLRGGSPQKAEPVKRLSKKALAAQESAPGDDKKKEKRPANRDVEFNPQDEFGADQIPNPKAQSAAAANEDDGKRRAPRRQKEDGGRGEPATLTKRYIEGDATTQHKVRGFYIRVVMKNTFAPTLLAELANMPYPVEIVRAQVSDAVDARSYVEGRIEKASPQPSAQAARGPGVAALGPPKGGMVFGRGRQEKRAERAAVQNQKEKKKYAKQKGGLRPGEEEKRELLQAAMTDPYVGTVVVAGTMTIYKQYFTKEQPAKAKPAKANPSTKPQAAAPVESDAPADSDEPAPADTPEAAPAATDDKKSAEKKAPEAKTNGK
jgi:hypothetical protein